jgi:hypothetical protein
LDRIPVTALISDEVDRALLALLVIVLGYLMLRFRLIDNLWLENTGLFSIERSKKKSKQSFEERFDK